MSTQPPAAPAPPPDAPPIEQRYRSLRVISTLLTVVGWLVLVVGGIAVAVGAVLTSGRQGAAQALLVVVIGALYVALFSLYAFAGAAFIRLAMAVEENTRFTARALGHTGKR